LKCKTKIFIKILVSELLVKTCKKYFIPQVSMEIYPYISIYGNDKKNKNCEKMFLGLRAIK